MDERVTGKHQGNGRRALLDEWRNIAYNCLSAYDRDVLFRHRR